MKRVTILDVANFAGVSKSTVSQYLNKRFDYMGVETKKKIEKAIEELNYQPNIVARSLKVKSTKTIGVIVANILHEFSTQIIRAIEDVCHELDFHIIVCNADDNPVKEEKYINMLFAKQIDGLIVFPTSENIDLYDRLQNSKFPIVFMDRRIPSNNIDSILLDNEKAAAMAVEEFIRHGYERIGIVTTSAVNNVTPRKERLKGFEKVILENKLPLLPEYIKSAEINQIQIELEKMFNLAEPPQALLAGNDLTLFEVLKFVRKNKLSIPDDIAVIGIDDVSFADLYNPPLTTIKQPTFEMGEKAAELLFNKINKVENDTTNSIYRFKPELIVRMSC